MKKIILLSMLIVFAEKTFAQKKTFDLVSYTPPKTWKKEVTENITSYTIINNTTKNWCRINIVKSTISKGSIEQDFESEWQDLVVKNYKPTDTPQLNEIEEIKGWKIKAGIVKFTYNNSEAIAMLTTMSGFDRCASIVATTNSQDYFKDIEAFLSSVDLIKPEIISTKTPTGKNENISIIGTWGANASENSSYRINNGVMNYIRRQYTFYENGTYSFVSKAYDPLMSDIFLGKENGTYQISGNTVTINPVKSVLEAWSKKDGRDEWGKQLNSQNITLEKVSYRYTKHFLEGNKNYNLVLQGEKATQRDGPFSFSGTFANAWYYGPISPNNKVIELPK